MRVDMERKPVATKAGTTKASRHAKIVPPRNPNRRPTNISMERSIARMIAEDREVLRRATQ